MQQPDEKQLELRTSRLLLVIGLVAYAIFWVIIDRLGMRDPEPLRYVAVMILIAGALAASFVSDFAKKHLRKLVIVLLYVIASHFFLLLYTFRLAPVQMIDMLIFLSAVTATSTFIFESRAGLLSFLLFSTAGAAVAAYAVKDPLVDIYQFFAAIAVLGFVGFMAMAYQMRMLDKIRGSEQQLRNAIQQSHRYDFIVNTSREFMTLINREYKYEAVNDAYCEAHHKPREILIGRPVTEVWGGDLFERVIRGYLDECFKGNIVNYRVGFEFPALGPRFFDVTYYPYRGAGDEITHAVVVSRDHTEKKIAEDRLIHEALHDALTGLPNRHLLTDRIGHALKKKTREDDFDFSLLFLDLDRFKIVNDTMGHLAGDKLIIAVARVLEKCTRPGDTVGRLGGDEFVLLLENTNLQGAEAVASRVLRELGQPLMLGDSEVFTGASIGIAPYVSGYAGSEEMLRDADTAMYRSKALGRSRYTIFDEEMRFAIKEQLTLEAEMRHGLERGEFTVYFQPVFKLSDGTLTGYETLLRWKHSRRGVLGPSVFLAVAEEAGLIDTLGEFVLREACRFLSRLPGKDTFVSVNVSARQFQRHGILESVIQSLADFSTEPSRLMLELKEASFARGFDEVASILRALSRLGVKLAVDNFGTGNASIVNLKGLPLHMLKIDGSFARGLPHDASDRALVAGMISIAHSLGIVAGATMVETASQETLLRSLGCDTAQGFHFAEPADSSAWLSQAH